MHAFKPALAYFGLVFGVGFMLGILRVAWLVPHLGERVAELAEMPFMLAVIVLAARWVVHRAAPRTASAWLGVGFAAVGLLLLAELGSIIALRQGALADYIAGRDPVSGSVYLAVLLLMALMPWLLVRLRLRVRRAVV